MLPPRLPGRLPGPIQRVGAVAVLTEVRVAQNLDLLLRTPSKIELWANQAGTRTNALKSHVFQLSTDASQAHFSLCLRALPAGAVSGSEDALFERTETVIQRDELERLV